MVLKLLGALITVSAAGWLGFHYAGRMKRRVSELQDVLRALLIVRSEVAFRLSARGEVFRRVQQQVSSPVGAVFAETPSFENLALRAGDRQVLEEFLQSFGALDYDSQLRAIDLCRERAAQQLAAAREDYLRRAKLVRTLCPLCAGALCLLLL